MVSEASDQLTYNPLATIYIGVIAADVPYVNFGDMKNKS